MVYVYLARAALADVRAYYNGAGKREAGVPVLNQGSGVVEILYYIRKNKPAAVAAQPARATAPAPAASSEAPANEGAPAAAPAPQAPAAADTAKQAIDAVNALKGLFGR